MSTENVTNATPVDGIVIPLDDMVVGGVECDCEFSEYDDEDAGQESWHFKRCCLK